MFVSLTGYCSSSVLNNEHAFICYFIVKNQYRGRGIGGKLLSKTLKALGNRNVLVYSTPDGHEIYKKKGGFIGGDPPVTFYAFRFVPHFPGKCSFYYFGKVKQTWGK